MYRHTLLPHPQCAQSSLGQHAHLTVQLTQSKQHWQLRYLLQVEPARLRWPAPHPTPGPTDGLWQHTCFELFVGQAQNPAYLEFNFSPSGQWAAYAFSAERQRASQTPQARLLAGLQLQSQAHAHGFILEAHLPCHVLSFFSAPTAWRLGLSAVLEDCTGQLSHWALHHPKAQADFHHPEGWLAQAPGATAAQSKAHENRS